MNIEEQFKETVTLLKKLNANRNLAIDIVNNICYDIELQENKLAYLSSMISRVEMLEDNLELK